MRPWERWSHGLDEAIDSNIFCLSVEQVAERAAPPVGDVIPPHSREPYRANWAAMASSSHQAPHPPETLRRWWCTLTQRQRCPPPRHTSTPKTRTPHCNRRPRTRQPIRIHWDLRPRGLELESRDDNKWTTNLLTRSLMSTCCLIRAYRIFATFKNVFKKTADVYLMNGFTCSQWSGYPWKYLVWVQWCRLSIYWITYIVVGSKLVEEYCIANSEWTDMTRLWNHPTSGYSPLESCTRVELADSRYELVPATLAISR